LPFFFAKPVNLRKYPQENNPLFNGLILQEAQDLHIEKSAGRISTLKRVRSVKTNSVLTGKSRILRERNRE